MSRTKNTIINFGDKDLFTEIYRRYFHVLKYFGLRYIEDENIVCDIIHDIFTNLWNNKQTFDNEISARVFLYRAVKNQCLNIIRNDAIHNRIHQNLKTVDSDESFMNNIIETEVFTIIRAGFEELSESVKKVYTMSLEGMSHAEIAEALKISVNTVKKHKNTANHFLRDKFKDLFMILVSI